MAAPVRKIVVSPKRRGDVLDQDSNAIMFWRRLNYKDFAAASTTGNLDLTGFPGGLVIEGAFLYLVTVFAGGSVSAATLSVGTTGSVADYVAATNVFTGATAPATLVGKTLVPGTFLNMTTPTSAGTIRVQLLTTTANTNALLSGKADLYVRLRAASIRNS